MNELHLFAGAGGGILAGQLLGNRCVCAVEWNRYAQAILLARQNDGTFPAFPIWDDVQTFDGRQWRHIVDLVAGGFPCQDISIAGGGKGWTASAAACGTTRRASLAKYDPGSHTLKTAQLSLAEDLTESCATLPASGLMRDGEIWELPTLAPRTCVSAPGFWPTPVASAAKGSSPKALTRKSGRDRTRDRLDHAVMASDGGQLNPQWVEWLMGWPIGHTALEPLETGRYQEWQQQHSTGSRGREEFMTNKPVAPANKPQAAINSVATLEPTP